MSTVFLLLDAFRHDYLSKEITPFLWKCALEGEHYEGVVQSMGFCERTEILTGMSGDESGFFTAIGFDPSNSPYANIRYLFQLNAAEQLLLILIRFFSETFANKVHKWFRSYTQKFFSQKGIMMPSYMIPFNWLKYFSLTEDRMDLRRSDVYKKPSIFTLLTMNGKTYFYDSFTALGLTMPFTSDQERLDGVLRDITIEKKDLYLIYISIPDFYGHRYGPDSPDFRVILCNMDQMLERFVMQAEKISTKNTFLFVGDHGMLPVTKHFNALSEIKKLLRVAKLKAGKDVVYFLDSTMVRLWVLNNHTQDILKDMLKNASVFEEYGSWMNTDTAKCYNVPWPDRRYGDHLWVANPGVLVFPDFFHHMMPCKGMHGYNPQIPDSQGVCILWGNGILAKKHPPIPLSSVFNILKKSLDL